MPPFRIKVGVIVLAAASLAGDQVCRRVASGGDQEYLLRQGADTLARLPSTIGTWRTLESAPLDDDVLAMLQCRAHQSRVYIDEETGEKVRLVLLFGASGPLVAHTPEICYSSANFEIIESSQPVIVRGAGTGADVFDKVVFRSRSVAAEAQQVLYAWLRPGGQWEAPRNPRLKLAGAPILFKLQLSTEAPLQSTQAKDQSATADADQRFLSDLLPILDRQLIIR